MHARIRACPVVTGYRKGEMAERFKAPVLKTGEGSNLPWVRIPLSPPDTQDAPKGAFCVSGGETGQAEAARVRRIRRERIRTAEWLALGRSRPRVRCRMHLTIPLGNAVRSTGCSGFAARRPERGVLRIWRRERAGRSRAGLTDSPGANPDSRMAGPWPLAAKGEVQDQIVPPCHYWAVVCSVPTLAEHARSCSMDEAGTTRSKSLRVGISVEASDERNKKALRPLCLTNQPVDIPPMLVPLVLTGKLIPAASTKSSRRRSASGTPTESSPALAVRTLFETTNFAPTACCTKYPAMPMLIRTAPRSAAFFSGVDAFPVRKKANRTTSTNAHGPRVDKYVLVVASWRGIEQVMIASVQRRCAHSVLKNSINDGLKR